MSGLHVITERKVRQGNDWMQGEEKHEHDITLDHGWPGLGANRD